MGEKSQNDTKGKVKPPGEKTQNEMGQPGDDLLKEAGRGENLLSEEEQGDEEKLLNEEGQWDEEELLSEEDPWDEEELPEKEAWKEGKLSKEEIKKLENEINRLADLYYEAKMKGNEGEMRNIKLMLLIPYLERFDNFCNLSDSPGKESDFLKLVVEVFPKYLEEYNPSVKGNEGDSTNFSKYVSSNLRWRVIDIKGEKGDKKKKGDKEETEAPIRVLSLDQLISKEDQHGNTYLDLHRDTKTDVEENVVTTQIILSFIRKFCDELNGRNSSKKAEWFRIFLTEDITCLCKSDLDNRLSAYSTNLLSTINLEYLDFYMSEISRCTVQIRDTPLKKNSEIGYYEGKGETVPENEIMVPLRGYVSLLFLGLGLSKQSSRSGYYTQYKNFKELFQESHDL